MGTTEVLDSNYMPEPMSGCWIWTGVVSPEGYGMITVDGKRYRAHRLHWELNNGEIPLGMFVCHKCDNPSCINLAHLFLGTPRANTRDMMTKGRQRFSNMKIPNLVAAELKKARTQCKRGHFFTEETTYVYRNKRHCKTCHNLLWREKHGKDRVVYGNN